jgi:hypothetical protein
MHAPKLEMSGPLGLPQVAGGLEGRTIMLMRNCLAGMLAPTAAPAFANEPVPMATIDYAVTYTLSGASKGQMTYRHSASANRVLMQMTVDGQRASVLLEPKSGIGRMWTADQPGMVMRMDGPPSDRPNGRKLGQAAQHAGEACTQWQVDQARVCLASDGVPLAFEAEGTRAVATRVERANQPAASFQPPRGQEMRMPGMKLPAPF